MNNVIGGELSVEDRQVNWTVMRSLKEDLKVNLVDLPLEEEDRVKAYERLEEASSMYNYFLHSYVNPNVRVA